MAYGDLKNFSKETASKIKHLILLKIRCQRGLYKFFDKKSSGGAVERPRPGTLAMGDKSAIKNIII